MIKIAKGVYKLTYGNPERFTPMNVIQPEIRVNEIEDTKGEIPHFDLQDIKGRKTTRGYRLSIPMDEDENIYGLGLQLKSFNQKGRKKVVKTNADPAIDTGESHAPVPFYVSNKGYGVYIDTARYVSFYFGTSVESSVKQSNITSSAAGSTEELYKVEARANRVYVDIPVVAGVDVYFFAGETMMDATQKYNLLSGGGCVPPMWGLGVMYRAYGQSDEKHILDIADRLRSEDMPCDIFGIEPGWQTHAYSCTYEWNKQAFPNHKKMLDKLSKAGYKVNLWEHAYVHPDSPIHDELNSSSGDFLVWGGLIPDFNTNKARNVFKGYHKTLIEEGVSGFKLDECDNSDYTGNWSFPDFTSFPSGLDGEQMHELLGPLYGQTMADCFLDINKRTYGQIRAAHALNAPNPYVIYSDLYDHVDFIRGLATSGFSGILWTPEVRQCESAEELIRRLQTTVLSPMACINCWMIPNEPWKQYDLEKNKANQFLYDNNELQNICRGVLKFRMSMIPYLYSTFVDYYKIGKPPVSALVANFPNDKETYSIDDQFMIGDRILAAPIIWDSNKANQSKDKARNDGAKSNSSLYEKNATFEENKDRVVTSRRQVYLPEGVWYDFNTREKYEGPRWITVDAPLSEIPLYIKENSIIPFAKPVNFVSENVKFQIEMLCFGKTGEATLYSDNDNTCNYKQYGFDKIKLHFKNDKFGIEGNVKNTKYLINGATFIR